MSGSALRRIALPLHVLRSLPPALLIASGIGCGLVLAQTAGLVTPALCLAPSGAWTASPGQLWDRLGAALAVNTPAALAWLWFAMLLAMMPLLLEQPVRHVWRRSLARRQRRAIALFAIGYGAVWLAAGALLTIIAITLGIALATTTHPALASVLLGMGLAAGWVLTPFSQDCLNRCHRRPCLAAFGTAADADVLRFGLTHGGWCVGACWPVMLLPLLAADWHLPVMAVATLWLISERYRTPRPARWGFAPGTRAAAARTRDALRAAIGDIPATISRRTTSLSRDKATQ